MADTPSSAKGLRPTPWSPSTDLDRGDNSPAIRDDGAGNKVVLVDELTVAIWGRVVAFLSAQEPHLEALTPAAVIAFSDRTVSLSADYFRSVSPSERPDLERALRMAWSMFDPLQRDIVFYAVQVGAEPSPQKDSGIRSFPPPASQDPLVLFEYYAAIVDQGVVKDEVIIAANEAFRIIYDSLTLSEQYQYLIAFVIRSLGALRLTREFNIEDLPA